MPALVNLQSAGQQIKKEGRMSPTCSSPALRPTWLRWLERKERGQSDESRANSSQQKSGTSPPDCMQPCSSTALPSISSFSASSSPSSSSPLWNTRSHSCCRSAADEQSIAACHWKQMEEIHQQMSTVISQLGYQWSHSSGTNAKHLVLFINMRICCSFLFVSTMFL